MRNIFLVFVPFLAEFLKLLEFLDKSNKGDLVFVTSPFRSYLSLWNQVTFGKHRRMGGGYLSPAIEGGRFQSQPRPGGWECGQTDRRLNPAPVANDGLNLAGVKEPP